MELIIFIIAFIALRYFVTNKRPDLKGKVNGVIFVPLISLLFCYLLYYAGDETSNKMLPSIDKLRYASTYTPYMGDEIDMAVRIAQDAGYMSDELVSRSSEFESAMGQANFAVIVSILGLIGAIIWVFNIGLYLWEGKNNMTVIKLSSIATWVFLFLGVYFVFSSFGYIYVGSEAGGFPIFVIMVYAPVAAGLIYWYNKSYKKITEIIETKPNDNE